MSKKTRIWEKIFGNRTFDFYNDCYLNENTQPVQQQAQQSQTQIDQDTVNAISQYVQNKELAKRPDFMSIFASIPPEKIKQLQSNAQQLKPIVDTVVANFGKVSADQLKKQVSDMVNKKQLPAPNQQRPSNEDVEIFKGLFSNIKKNPKSVLDALNESGLLGGFIRTFNTLSYDDKVVIAGSEDRYFQLKAMLERYRKSVNECSAPKSDVNAMRKALFETLITEKRKYTKKNLSFWLQKKARAEAKKRELESKKRVSKQLQKQRINKERAKMNNYFKKVMKIYSSDF